MKIRKYLDSDFENISQLFYNTVHIVNAKDYTAEQLTAWTDNSRNLVSRRADLLKQYTLVAETDGEIAGFGSIDNGGCLDLLFVHKDCQKQGVATAICGELEKNFPVITVYASVTAKSFFEKRGYTVVTAREAVCSDIKLKNYKMLKIQCVI